MAKARRGQGEGSGHQASPHADCPGRYHSMTRQLLRKADGVVLMYDVTSWESFAHVRYWLDCLRVSSGLSPLQVAVGVGLGVWSQGGTCIVPMPPFFPGLQMTPQTCGLCDPLRACGWMSWEHSHRKKTQPHSTASKINYFLYPLNISFLYTAAPCCLFNAWG